MANWEVMGEFYSECGKYSLFLCFTIKSDIMLGQRKHYKLNVEETGERLNTCKYLKFDRGD